MIRKIEGIPVVTEMDHTWSLRTPELREKYDAARMAMDDLLQLMNEQGIDMEHGEWLETVREMAAANAYADHWGCTDDVGPHWLPVKIVHEGGDWLRCHYHCPEHGWHTCGYSATLPFRY